LVIEQVQYALSLEDAVKKFGPIITLSAALTVLIVLILLSCGAKHYTVTVENQSAEKTVTYIYGGVTETLPASSSKEYRVEAFTLPPGDISVEGAASVEMESQGSGERYVFKDRKSLDLEVENRLSVAIELMADKYIEVEEGGKKLTILQVSASSKSDGSAKIYTEIPKFAVLSKDSHSLIYPPPSVTWNIKNSVMKVVIAEQ
jgi:hypothetical protein